MLLFVDAAGAVVFVERRAAPGGASLPGWFVAASCPFVFVISLVNSLRTLDGANNFSFNLIRSSKQNCFRIDFFSGNC